jgi:hypothetical protein
MVTKKWQILLCFVALLLLAACKGDGEATTVEEIESQTEISTVIPAELPTDIPPEDTPMSEEVKQEDPAPEEPVAGNLLDAEAMIERFGNYVLRPEDLPHSYSLSEGGELHITTRRLINEMGELEAKTYVRNTGRIDGWWMKLDRTNKEDFAPGSFESMIELFDSQAGAQAAIAPENYQLHQDESRAYQLVDGGCDLGDRCEFYYSEKEEPTTELVIAQYNIAFTYKNAFVWVMSRGLIIDMEADYILDAARSVLAKLESAPTK